MMATEEEKRQIKAFNMGYTLSKYEPKLLENIIKQNKNNEFVKMMTVGKDQQEFHRGIPRKDFTKEYKNGYRNAYALSNTDPEILKSMLASKELNKDFKRGLADGNREYNIRQTQLRLKAEREQQQSRQQDLERDMGLDL